MRPQNDIVRKDDGRLVYTNPRGELELLTQEHVHRGPNWRVGEPEPEMRVRRPRRVLPRRWSGSEPGDGGPAVCAHFADDPPSTLGPRGELR